MRRAITWYFPQSPYQSTGRLKLNVIFVRVDVHATTAVVNKEQLKKFLESRHVCLIVMLFENKQQTQTW